MKNFLRTVFLYSKLLRGMVFQTKLPSSLNCKNIENRMTVVVAISSTYYSFKVCGLNKVSVLVICTDWQDH